MNNYEIPMNTPEIPTRNYVMGLAVGPVLVLVSIYFLVFHLGRDMRIWLATRDGIETPVIKVIDAQLHTAGRKGSQEVLAHYTYRADGMVYTGTLTSVHQRADNFSSFHQQLYDRIMAYKNGAGSLSCFVSRKDPSLCVIDNTLRPSRIAVYALFILVPIGLGIHVTFYSIQGLRKRSKS
jgi:hypothetical protein